MTLSLDNDKTYLLDFYAPWCGPCRMLAPIIDDIAAAAPDNVIVRKINVDDEPALASQFSIMSVPTVLIVKGGDVVKTFSGYQSKATLLEALGV